MKCLKCWLCKDTIRIITYQPDSNRAVGSRRLSSGVSCTHSDMDTIINITFRQVSPYAYRNHPLFILRMTTVPECAEIRLRTPTHGNPPAQHQLNTPPPEWNNHLLSSSSSSPSPTGNAPPKRAHNPMVPTRETSRRGSQLCHW
jgi:hypothetical protein